MATCRPPVGFPIPCRHRQWLRRRSALPQSISPCGENGHSPSGQTFRPVRAASPDRSSGTAGPAGRPCTMRDIWRYFGAELLWVMIPSLLVVAFAMTRLRRAPASRPHNVQVVARALLVVISLVAGAILFSPVSRTTHARFLDLHLL